MAAPRSSGWCMTVRRAAARRRGAAGQPLWEDRGGGEGRGRATAAVREVVWRPMDGPEALRAVGQRARGLRLAIPSRPPLPPRHHLPCAPPAAQNTPPARPPPPLAAAGVCRHDARRGRGGRHPPAVTVDRPLRSLPPPSVHRFPSQTIGGRRCRVARRGRAPPRTPHSPRARLPRRPLHVNGSCSGEGGRKGRWLGR